MAEVLDNQISWRNGFYPSAGISGPDSVPDSIRDGKNCWLLGPGLMKSSNGVLNTAVVGDTRLYLTGSAVGKMATGSVIPYRGGSFWFMGSGTVRIDTTVIGTATTSLQFVTSLGGTAIIAGLQTPTAPVIAEGAASTLNSGSYSIRLALFRGSTGAESIGSLPSNVLSISSRKIRVTFPAYPFTAALTDGWSVFCSYRGRGSIGPHFFLQNILESQVASGTPGAAIPPGGTFISSRVIDFEWNDSQLAALTPATDFNVPPVGTHVVSLGNCMIVLGSFGASNVFAGVSPSVPGRVEAYPANFTTFLNPLENIMGLAARPTDGEMLIWTANSLQALLLTGSPSVPVFTRAIWPSTGLPGHGCGCFAESTFYCYLGDAGPARLGGSEPDTAFALPILEFLRDQGWVPSAVVMGFDRGRDAVIFFGTGVDGSFGLPFMRVVSGGTWSVPISMPGPVQSAVTVAGQLKLSIGNILYDWEKGVGGADWFIKTQWYDGPNSFDRKTFRGHNAIVDTSTAPLTIETMMARNGVYSETAVSRCTTTTTGTGKRETGWCYPNVLCKAHSLKISANGAGHRIFNAQTRIIYEPGIQD